MSEFLSAGFRAHQIHSNHKLNKVLFHYHNENLKTLWTFADVEPASVKNHKESEKAAERL